MGASERNEQARGAFRERLKSLDPKKLVFVDEIGTNITLAPLYGWAPKGERVYGKTPRNWEKNVTLIASLSAEGITAAMSVEGATDGAAFQTYIEHFLLPTLERFSKQLIHRSRVPQTSGVWMPGRMQKRRGSLRDQIFCKLL